MSAGFEPIDNYEVAAFIAGGGTSQVLEVIEPGTHRHLAMKVINENHPDAKAHKASLKAEAAIAKQLDHPNVIHYEGFISGRDHTYLLMEYFRAPTLKVQLKLDQLGVHLRMKKLLEGVCAALQHIHDRGFIHRDIKPENVLMNKVGEVRLIDFSLTIKQRTGLGKLMGGKPATIQGTRTYIAPETIRKQAPVLQTDFYSLGILLFEVLTGRTPFQAPTPNELLQKHVTATPPNPSEFNPNITPEMDRLILKLLAKKPDQRGKDMAEISAELRRIRVFKEDIEEAKPVDENAPTPDLIAELAGGGVDSRLDAKRSELVRNNPELAAQITEAQDKRKAAEAAKKAKLKALADKGKKGDPSPAPTAAPPAPPMMMPPAAPFPYPAQPGYAMPPAPAYAPPMGYPQMPPQMPGYPGAPAATLPPGYPPAMLPPAGPARTLPPAPPVPGFPNSPVPVTMPVAPNTPRPPAPPTAVPPAAAARPAAPPVAPSKGPEELEYMTDLPDVL